MGNRTELIGYEQSKISQREYVMLTSQGWGEVEGQRVKKHKKITILGPQKCTKQEHYL